MRGGFKAWDADTHVNPSAEVLDRYVDPGFRPRLPELEPYKAASSQIGGTPGWHQYRVGTKLYRRILGEGGPHETFTGRGTRWMGSKQPRAGVQDDQAANRVADMDDEGTDAQLLVPTGWGSVVGLPDVAFEINLIRAWHRHANDFCGQFPDRLKTMIVVSSRAVDEAVREIKQWGTSKWAVAVIPLLAKNVPVDHPDLNPIWQAAQEHDLSVVHHSLTWNPPYFPGYEDLWDNIFLGRLASHPWGGMRFMAAFIGAGILERFPKLRMGILECGSGWLPFWGKRMDEQHIYVGGTSPSLKHSPSEYMQSGRFFCSIERHEGEEMFNYVRSVVGDDVLMWGSDYPHSECQFPDSIDNILAWSSLKPETRKKLLWDNAARFYKRT
jgi:predicted TIM-barrel fold metal-dependent hydrolase